MTTKLGNSAVDSFLSNPKKYIDIPGHLKIDSSKTMAISLSVQQYNRPYVLAEEIYAPCVFYVPVGAAIAILIDEKGDNNPSFQVFRCVARDEKNNTLQLQHIVNRVIFVIPMQSIYKVYHIKYWVLDADNPEYREEPSAFIKSRHALN